jgi:hypothetical protein
MVWYPSYSMLESSLCCTSAAVKSELLPRAVSDDDDMWGVFQMRRPSLMRVLPMSSLEFALRIRDVSLPREGLFVCIGPMCAS